jgi:hypothetical protein
MFKLLHPASMLTTMGLVCGFITLAAAPSYPGNEIDLQSLGDVIPACDILAQTVGRLVESVPGDGTEGFTRERLISHPGDGTDAARGELAFVALSCNQSDDTMATITSPVQISGLTLDINVATTRAYIAFDDPTIAFSQDLLAALGNPDTLPYTFLPLMAVTSETGGAVRTSDAALLASRARPDNRSVVGQAFIALGIGFEVEVNGSRIPSGQYSFATTLSVVPR